MLNRHQVMQTVSLSGSNVIVFNIFSNSEPVMGIEKRNDTKDFRCFCNSAL